MTTNRTNQNNSKPEEVIAYPGSQPVKSSEHAKGGNPNPDDPMTGGGKIKSATRQSEPLLDEDSVGQNPSKSRAGASMPDDGDEITTEATALGNKEGMSKSSQRPAPNLSTATQPASSRVKPNAEE